jgi:hypothetical protein
MPNIAGQLSVNRMKRMLRAGSRLNTSMLWSAELALSVAVRLCSTPCWDPPRERSGLESFRPA